MEYRERAPQNCYGYDVVYLVYGTASRLKSKQQTTKIKHGRLDGEYHAYKINLFIGFGFHWSPNLRWCFSAIMFMTGTGFEYPFFLEKFFDSVGSLTPFGMTLC